ncbi:dihydrodipicolinate synthase family protein [Coraliomargarita sp. SDUM461004]|uniref:Dihydrodipicolinate synthase family protein n=1 Tax=Thalassobacterium sedimentorum TaxID=3041258 RepID=A0ABU1AL15_9BACT|nr:dihydrodipicolinate synthase family protein [Coraliomargarita sp. SDUM461004]MDQ8194530.1 dihydrodipicolinate synthase family protein [Coraliomargarita sp. SDUM461004]
MKIHGIIPPLVTPLKADETLDLEAADRLIEHVIAGGVHGLFILGTTGEGPNLSYQLRRQYIDFVTKKVNGRIPVIVSISDTAYTESLALAEHAKQAGADAVAFTPPYYFIPGAPELHDFVQRMADNLSLPFFLYNMPALTKVSLPLDVVELGLSMHNCLGLKDSSGDMFYYKKVKRLIAERDLTLLIGPEELLAESMLAGGNGGINGGANVFPKLYVKIYNLMRSGQFIEAQSLQREVMEVSCQLFTIGKHGSSIIKGIKGALEVRGIAKRHLASPFRGFNDIDLARVSETINGLEARPALKELLA